jgi:hypothetical protein
MKFIKTYENFTEMEGHEMEEMCPECQCKMTECECGGPMAHDHEMEEEKYDIEGEEEGMMPDYFGEEEEEGGMIPGEEEKLPMAYEEEEDEEEEKHTFGGHIMSFQEAKKAKPDFLDLDKDGDKKESMKKAAADKKKGGKKEEDKKETKKGGKLSKAQEKLPEGLKKAIKAGVKD